MIDFTEIPFDSDLWELFTRDFLQEFGFHIESPPDRGADQGKDMLVTEEISGTFYRGRFRWLVSCKHFAHSGKSVNESDDERNLLERMGAFEAQGFIGVYSTLASAGLNTRLRLLRDQGKIQDYRIFDHKLIENHLITVGFSEMMMRYFPESYKGVKPLHQITVQYESLPCDKCGKDLLDQMFKANNQAVLCYVSERSPQDEFDLVKDVYVACKGKCDSSLERAASDKGFHTPWKDLGDLVIPIVFLQSMFAVTNRIRNGWDKYTEEAYEKHQRIFVALAQKVLRFTTERERQRFATLNSLPPGM